MNKTETPSEYSSYDRFLHENRIKINHYLNIVLLCFTAAGPAIAFGIYAGVFPDVGYMTCVNISMTLLLLSVVHFILMKFIPGSVATSVFALVALNLLLVYMFCSHVSIYLTWFLIPLLSLMFCDKKIYIFAIASNYIFMMIATWLAAPYYAAMQSRYATPLAFFVDRAGGFTIEALVMFVSGYALGRVSVRYMRELISNYRQIRQHEEQIQERMSILDSMAEIYDNVNLINFVDNTEMSLREDKLVPKQIDMSVQTHTAMTRKLKDHVMPDQVEDFLNYTNLRTIRARLSHKKIISADFIDIVNGWFRAQYISVDSTIDGIPNVVIYTTRNIDEEKRREEHLIRISLTDELTRLFNRRCYEEDIAIYREKGLDPDFVLLSIDVNGLKTANDTKGHAAGDELIKGAADCLAASVGSHGKAYRTGGDEFLAIVHTDDPGAILDNIREKTEQWHGMYLDEISMSVGYAACRDHPGASIDDLEKAADASMYAEKERYYREKGLDRRKSGQ